VGLRQSSHLILKTAKWTKSPIIGEKHNIFIILRKKNVLIDEQHGFRLGRLTVTCDVAFCNDIFNAFDVGAQVDVIYAD